MLNILFTIQYYAYPLPYRLDMIDCYVGYDDWHNLMVNLLINRGLTTVPKTAKTINQTYRNDCS